MGSSLKALIKVPKKVKKKSTKALKALQPKQYSAPQSQTYSGTVSDELADIARQAGTDALTELATPLQPLLSWFNEGSSGYANQTLSTSTRLTSVATPPGNRANSPALLRLPLKSPPCKRCPALIGDICKCAAKRLG